MYKVIDSFKRIREDGKPEYMVKVKSRYGIFSDSVSPCNEDLELSSDWAGYRLAEYKCSVKILKVKAGILRERMNGILYAYNALNEQYNASEKYEDPKCFMYDLMHQYNIAKREYSQVYSKYCRLRDNYNVYVNACLQGRKDANSYIDLKRKQAEEQEEQ